MLCINCLASISINNLLNWKYGIHSIEIIIIAWKSYPSKWNNNWHKLCNLIHCFSFIKYLNQRLDSQLTWISNVISIHTDILVGAIIYFPNRNVNQIWVPASRSPFFCRQNTERWRNLIWMSDEIWQ